MALYDALRHGALAVLFVAVPGTLACSDATGSEDAALYSAGLSAGAQAELAGTWMLNREESDPPLRLHRRGKDQEGAFHRGPRGDRPDPGDRPSGEGFRRHGRGTLVITQDESTVTLSHGRREITLYADGRTVEKELRNGRTVTVSARWDGEALVVVREGPRRKMTQTFELSEDGQKLFVTMRPEGDDIPEDAEHRRVYDRQT